MLRVELEAVITHLKEFAWGERKSLEIILIGGIAIQYYGMKDRATIDIDAEIKGNVEGLFNFLKDRNIPSDIVENISGWSVVGMPAGYKLIIPYITKNNFPQSRYTLIYQHIYVSQRTAVSRPNRSTLIWLTENCPVGNDKLFGEAGDDALDGDIDSDTCNGGAHVTGDTAANCEVISNVP